METSWNIATSKTAKDWEQFSAAIVRAAKEGGKIEVTKLLCVPGPGCNNLGMVISGEPADAEAFVGSLTLALMPAKYSRCDSDPIWNTDWQDNPQHWTL